MGSQWLESAITSMLSEMFKLHAKFHNIVHVLNEYAKDPLSVEL